MNSAPPTSYYPEERPTKFYEGSPGKRQRGDRMLNRLILGLSA